MFTAISKKHIASIFSVENHAKQSSSNKGKFDTVYSSTLKMEEICSTETSVNSSRSRTQEDQYYSLLNSMMMSLRITGRENCTELAQDCVKYLFDSDMNISQVLYKTEAK
jgi:hypothetical protein